MLDMHEVKTNKYSCHLSQCMALCSTSSESVEDVRIIKLILGKYRMRFVVPVHLCEKGAALRCKWGGPKHKTV